MKTDRLSSLRLAGLCAATSLLTLAGQSAHAIVNGVDTASFSAVGAIGGASGVQIADNWVLTAAHVAAGVVLDSTTFESVAGSSTVDAVYMFSSAEFPNNDISLLHLSSSIDAALPVLNAQALSSSQASRFGQATIVSAQNASPNGYGVTSVKSAMTTNYENGQMTTVNWVITQGGASVQGGDSGGALFKGTPSDSAGTVLVGISSAAITYTTGESVSAFVQPAAYKSWINSTMLSSGQQAVWSSTPLTLLANSVVPEPGTNALFVLAGALALTRRAVRHRLAA